MSKTILGFLALIFLLGATGAQAAASYVVAVVPRVPADQTHREWQPLLDRLSHELGVKFVLRQHSRRADFEREFAGGAPDFVFLSPYHLVMAHRAQGYLPLVRGSDNPLTGVLVVRADSSYQQARDLREPTIAFPSPNAFAASLYMRALLTEREEMRFTPVWANTHSNAFRSVIYGETMAGSGANDVFAAEPEAVRRQLRVIYETPPAPQHALGAHPRVPPKLRQSITAALLALDGEAAGGRLLHQAHLGKPVAADYDRDYRALEKLGLDKYVITEPP